MISKLTVGGSKMVGVLIVGLASIVSTVAAEARSLSLAERVAAQRAIEQVYWSHRLWPKENPTPKPPLSAVLSDAAIRARVEDTLRKSNALEKYWHRPITADQLQAELDRMAAHTHDPRLLQESFTALGNDPRLIAETLARQALVDRLIRNWYATDARFHGTLKKKAKTALAACQSVECMPAMGGEYSETTLKVEAPRTRSSESVSRPGVVRLEGEEWKRQLADLSQKLGGDEESLPIARLSGLEETSNAFVVTAVLVQGKGEVKMATVIWPKTAFDIWWERERGSLGVRSEGGPNGFTLPTIAPTECVTDTWTSLPGSARGRTGHTAVWTGTEMIVWGGGSQLSNGARYNPSTDTWVPTSNGTNAPDARSAHTAVWTGTEMMIWGGAGKSAYSSTGGRYNPSTDTWTPTSTGPGTPGPRWLHTAVWTGTEMVVWGGYNGGLLNTGGRYNPSTDTWTPTSIGANVPAEREEQTAVWTGSEMIVWGGYGGSTIPPLNTGGRYNPSTDTWTQTSIGAHVPSGRREHTAVWTRSEMIIWGGFGGADPNAGARYNPSTDTWIPTSIEGNAPAPRSQHTAVWTGTEMIVWGGIGDVSVLNDGSRYDPSTDTWTTTSTAAGVPTARAWHTAIWTGTEMIVWGGAGIDYLNTGSRYSPATDSWTPTSTIPQIPGEPSPRHLHTSVWTGTEMIVWGGYAAADGTFLSTGGRYTPSLDSWGPTSMGAHVPAPRAYHTAVWTGREMIVWGAEGNTGGRYDPSADIWTPTSTGANAPAFRWGHSAVWTGREMIVWGGYGGSCCDLNDGARYDPSTDTWSPTSTAAGVPTARVGHTAVWTGTEMIVWGGDDGAFSNTGGRYDPSADSWTTTSTGANVPTARGSHTAVWSGVEMIVWGGQDDSDYLDTGGRYNPSTNAWTSTSQGTSTPETRGFHTAVWTGAEMIIWGGFDQTCEFVCCPLSCDVLCRSCSHVGLSSGSRYDPVTDTWSPTSMTVAPERFYHTAIWTGTEMMVWGGSHLTDSVGDSYDLDDGGLYCACPSGRLYYRDADGDGYGDAAIVGTSCDGTIPAGYVVNDTDCNDASASVHPGALELCNAIDDDCNGAVDDAAPPGAVAPVTFGGDAQTIEWTPGAGAQTYDVVYGDLVQLRSSGGDFTTATLGCLTAGTVATSADSGTLPQTGQAFWILVRGDNCIGTGTYDSGDPSQVGSRDAEINASPNSCGY